MRNDYLMPELSLPADAPEALVDEALACISDGLPAPGGGTYGDYLASVNALAALGASQQSVEQWASDTGRGRAQTGHWIPEYTWESLPIAGTDDPVATIFGVAKRYGFKLPRRGRGGAPASNSI